MALCSKVPAPLTHFITSVSPRERNLSWLYKRAQTRVIKPSSLTGLIFTLHILAHGFILASAGAPPRWTYLARCLSSCCCRFVISPSRAHFSDVEAAAAAEESSAAPLDMVGSTPAAVTALPGAITACQTAEWNEPVLNHSQLC